MLFESIVLLPEPSPGLNLTACAPLPDQVRFHVAVPVVPRTS
ncbi:hypothetical protein P4U44_02575 [Alkalihalobacillus alcalophilus]|nr:hypothetical protein [Alkalihalobacillus alcalophilus]MED1560796.1 hypothetical protein [Alkalihalobacillus alcalophilus]